MFRTARPKSSLQSAFTILELIYHDTVYSIRRTHNNAFIALFMNIMTVIIMVLAFYLLFTVLGLKGAKMRGDFLLFMMSGIFIFLTHIKAVGAVSGAAGPASPMMQHAPMNTAISIASAALGSLYIQVLSLIIVLFVYHTIFVPITIYQPIYAFGMVLMAWFTGCAVGLVLLALRPWFPGFGQDVRRQHAATVHVRHVFLESALSQHRPGAWLCLHQLLSAQDLAHVSDLHRPRSGDARVDRRVLHAPSCVALLGGPPLRDDARGLSPGADDHILIAQAGLTTRSATCRCAKKVGF
jgi:hypothetical protein